MKIILTVLICLCGLVGCGEKVEPKQQKEAPSTPKVEANAPVTPKTQPSEELENPQPPKITPEKLITDSNVEEAIRAAIKKPTGELTMADLDKVGGVWLRPINQLAEVPKSLEKLTQLKQLDLAENRLTSVKGLEKLTQLTHLDLESNQLTELNGLEKLTKLERLSLMYNPDLTKAQIDQLQKALPKCKISHNATK